MSREARAARVFLVAGEPSGDELGAGLMRALRAALAGEVRFEGVGGEAMAGEGLTSLFPLSDITAMGVASVVAALPRIVRRGYQVVDAVVAAAPDILVVIDSPDFTHAVAKRVRPRLPGLPILDYVSPSVWAWRPGRAPRMRAYIDHVLALKPFEPEVHRRLGGPPCTYVGHPLVERLAELRPAPGERTPLGAGPTRLVVLPGSRRSEIRRLMEPFGLALGRLAEAAGPFEVVLPAVAHLEADIRERASSWPVRPEIVTGGAAKLAAFRRAHAALAASGTVTLELALAGVPMVVAYRWSRLEDPLKYVVKVPSVVLANLVLGENVVPERLQDEATPDKLAAALRPLLAETPERRAQVQAFARLDAIMETGSDKTPSERAAAIVIAELRRSRQSPVSSAMR